MIQKKNRKNSIKHHLSQKMQSKKTRIYGGIFFIFLALLMLLSFTSFLASWKEDQDLLDMSVFDYLFDSSVRTANKMGKIGLLLSQCFVYNGFGVASYLFAFFSLILGLRFFRVYKKSLFAAFKNIVFAVLWISVAVSLSGEAGALSGKFGYEIHLWFRSFWGLTGEILFLLLTLVAFAFISTDGKATWIKPFAEKIFNKENFAFLKSSDSEEAKQKKEHRKQKRKEKKQNKEIEKEKLRQAAAKKEEEEEIEVSRRKEYLLGDDGEEIVVEQDDDPGFEVEIPQKETIVTSAANENGGVAESFRNQPQSEGDLLLNVSESEDILVNDISDKPVNYDPTLDLSNFRLPSSELLEEHQADATEVSKEELLRNKNKIVETLKHYKIEIRKIKATIGPTLTLYEIVPAPGVRISKIKNLEDDIALSLAALGIRIIAPMPGRGTIGIEVPNEKPDIVSFKSVVQSAAFQENKMELPIALGKNISNESYVFDLAKMPHVLVAGATGQGKSVGLNAMIASLLYKKHPAQLKFVLVDPKKVELTLYERLENHYIATLPDAEEPIITDNQEVINAVAALNVEMDDRYQLLKKAKVRNIKEYNKKFIARQLNPENGHKYLPYIVLIIDEFADLIMTAGKEIELPIARLAQLARAIGIHLIVATQRPSTNIITGVIKANFPARIAFRVASMMDSRTILDGSGANRLIGRGDMLIKQGSDTVRLQCAFIDTPELDKITEYIAGQQSYPMPFLLPEPATEKDEPGAVDLGKRDEFFEDAARIIVMNQQGSTSLIQRKLSLGYNRAGRIVDQLEAAGIVGPSKGSKARDVYIADELALERLLETLP